MSQLLATVQSDLATKHFAQGHILEFIFRISRMVAISGCPLQRGIGHKGQSVEFLSDFVGTIMIPQRKQSGLYSPRIYSAKGKCRFSLEKSVLIHNDMYTCAHNRTCSHHVRVTHTLLNKICKLTWGAKVKVI